MRQSPAPPPAKCETFINLGIEIREHNLDPNVLQIEQGERWVRIHAQQAEALGLFLVEYARGRSSSRAREKIRDTILDLKASLDNKPGGG